MTRVADGVRTALRGIGQTLITFGVVLLLFCVYELSFTNVYTGREQDRLGEDLRSAWQAPAPAAVDAQPGVPIGSGLAVLWIPRVGMSGSNAKVVVEGVGTEDLKRGPGHYPGTALPGAIGNSVISGHRTTYGAPFHRIDELQVGDAIVVETRDMWFTYRMTRQQIVAPTAVEVTYPVPGNRTARPTARLMTLTTCHPKFSARSRLVVSARLQTTLPKSAGRPPALSGTA